MSDPRYEPYTAPKFREYQGWTQDEATRLVRLWRTGYTGGQLAIRFGRSRSSVLGKLKRLGEIPRKSQT